jgi:short-subunit dehydrogenase
MSLSPVVPSLSEVLQPFSTVVLTGGSSGIGKSFIELCKTLSPNLVICNLSRRSPGKLFSENRFGKLNHFACDLSRSVEVERVVGELLPFLAHAVPTGQILLINNSGFGAFGGFPEPSLERQMSMIDLDVRAVVHLTGLLLPILRVRGGVVMNIASTVAFQPTAYAATYGASKAFVLHWTLALNEELRASAVRAIAVCPGTTSTDFFRLAGAGDSAALGPLSMSSEDVVRAALRALGAGRAQVVPGWKNKVLAFAGSTLPRSLVTRVVANLFRRMRTSNVQP